MGNTISQINENKYYNYIYLDPRKPGIYEYKELNLIFDHEPFYVGKGTGKRINSHNWNYYTNHSTGRGRFKYCLIKSINNLGLKPIVIKINSNISEKESL